MYTKLARWIWFFSSYMPLYFLLVLNNLDLKKINGKYRLKSICMAWREHRVFNLVLVVCGVLSIVVLCMMSYLESNEQLVGTAKAIKNRNGDILDYFITYLFPVLSMDIEKINSVMVNLLIFLIIGMIYVKGEMLHWNPTLFFLHYEIVEIDGKLIITRKKNELLMQNKIKIWVREIYPGIYLEKNYQIK